MKTEEQFRAELFIGMLNADVNGLVAKCAAVLAENEKLKEKLAALETPATAAPA